MQLKKKSILFFAVLAAVILVLATCLVGLNFSGQTANALPTSTETIDFGNEINLADRAKVKELITVLGGIEGNGPSYQAMETKLEDAISNTMDASCFTDAKTVTFAGVEFNIVYVSKAKYTENGTNCDDIIVTLWVSSGNIKSNYASYNDDTDGKYPANMYSSSYIRSTLTGSSYAEGKDAETLTAGVINDAWKPFNENGAFYNYLATPANMLWQENLSMAYMRFFNSNNNCPNEAWGTPIKGGFPDGYDYSGKEGYSDWKNDRIWLPAASEASAHGDVKGLWNTSDSQIQSEEGDLDDFCWSRSGSFDKYFHYVSPIYYNIIKQGVSEQYYVRPAIHLNLKTLWDKVNTPETYYWGIDSNGKLTVSPNQSDVAGAVDGRSGSFSSKYYENKAPWSPYEADVTSAEIKEGVAPEYTKCWFDGCYNMTEVDLSKLDTSNVTDMCYMFSNCQKLQTLDISSFDTANVTDMNSMFAECTGLNGTFGKDGTAIKIGDKFKTAKVTNMGYMFGSCENLTGLDLTSLVLTAVTSNDQMLSYCDGLNEIRVPAHSSLANAVIDLPGKFWDGEKDITQLTEETCQGADYIYRHDYCRVGTTAGVCEVCNKSVAAQTVINGINAAYATVNEAWNAATADRVNNAKVQLLADATTTKALVLNKAINLTLDLNGFILTVKDSTNGCAVWVQKGNAVLTITDGSSGKTHQLQATGSSTQWFTIDGGIITTKSDGGGLKISNGEVIMDGGTIFDCYADGGAGVNVWGVNSFFTLNKGSIMANVATGEGSGVHVTQEATFTMNDGIIVDNKQGTQGAVTVYCGTFIMNGGEIWDNQITGSIDVVGAGVYLSGASDAYTSEIRLGGAAKIYMNKDKDGKQSDLYLADFTKPVKILSAKATGTKKTGVRMYKSQTTDWTLTSGYKDAGMTDPNAWFVSESEFFRCELNSEGEVVLKESVEALVSIDGAKRQYVKFSDAWSAAKGATGASSVTVKLLSDVETATGIAISESDSNKVITLDLNGFVFKVTDYEYAVKLDSADAVLTITDGNSEKNNEMWFNSVKYTLKGGVITNISAINNTRKAAKGLYISEGKVVMDGGNIFGNRNTGSTYGAGVCIILGEFELKEGGCIIANEDETMGGGVRVGASSKFTMSGGKITNNTAEQGGGVLVQGTFTMTGGEITANEETESPFSDNCGGGVALFGNARLDISGGAKIYSNKSYDDKPSDVGVCVADNNIITGKIKIGALNGSEKIYLHIYNSSLITGEICLTEGFANTGLSKAEDLFEIGIGECGLKLKDGEVYLCELVDVAEVDIDGVKTQYNKFSDAWAAAFADGVSNATVELLADIVLEDPIEVVAGKEATLDLNGHTLTVKNGVNQTVITVNGKLTLTDGSEQKSGKVTGGKTGGVMVAGSVASFIMNGGEISGNSGSVAGGVYVYEGSFTMNDGKISDNTTGYLSGGAVYVIGGGSFRMNGGEISFNKGKGYGVYATGSFYVKGAVKIIENKKSDETNANVYLHANNRITVAEGGLTTGAKIGVSNTGDIATGFTQTTGKASDYFIPDNTANNCVSANNGTVKIGVHTGGTATCTQKKTCTACGERYGEVDANNHNISTDWSVDNVSGKHYHACLNGCSTKFDEAAHTPATDDNDCTTAIKCTVCQTVTTAAQTAHNFSGSYQTNGTQHWHVCARSGCNQTDTKISHTAGTAVRESVVEATCTTTGSYDEVVKCTVCNYEMSRTQKTVEKIAHGYGAWETTKNPTCTEAGSKKRVCTACGHTETETIEKTAHTEEVIPAENATCTATGLTAGKKCSVCGEILEAQAETAALGHDFGEPSFSWDEDNTSVIAEFTCKRGCGRVEREISEEISSETTVEPTVNEEGKLVYTVTVSFNGQTFTETKEITLPPVTDPDEPNAPDNPDEPNPPDEPIVKPLPEKDNDAKNLWWILPVCIALIFVGVGITLFVLSRKRKEKER